ncbi:unnamed protein product [Rotaria sp. Silwood2]|nr:unnamed protein product [Rotaria sp. Silwood2]CAF3094874.1 unnamed protein product [Rotaria sp. Silwood2]CAF4035342.1 unnamed protein product [Rotaria sp. Silwood2]CAF4384682.1 unnamed protein product [Rotaria sp. Silwood2]
MNLTGIFLLLVFSACIGTVTPSIVSNIISTIRGWIVPSDPLAGVINKTCLYFSQHPDRANITFIKINEILQKNNETTQYFATTLAYINAPENQLKLVSNTTACPMFFDELKNALVTDYQNGRLSLKNAKLAAVNKIIELYNTFKVW